MTGPLDVHPAQAATVMAGTWPLTDPEGPCRTWPLEPGVGCLPGDPAQWSTLQRFAVTDATEILWHLTAGHFGLCRVTVRPTGRPVRCHRVLQGVPVAAVGAEPGLCEGSCGCTRLQEVVLPGPVYRDPPGADLVHTLEVWVDGVQLPGGYALVGDGRLLRADGVGWPRCQHLERPLVPAAGDPATVSLGTFGVTYWRGRPVPAGGRRAVATLACELVRASTGDGACRLPARVEVMEREGVTYRMIDKQEFLRQGRVGIIEIDVWIASVNPRGRRSHPAVFSPDDLDYGAVPTSSAYPGQGG